MNIEYISIFDAVIEGSDAYHFLNSSAIDIGEYFYDDLDAFLFVVGIANPRYELVMRFDATEGQI